MLVALVLQRGHLLLSPVSSQLPKLVVESFLFDHSKMTLPALALTAVVVAHRPRHLLVVHLLAPIRLHTTPRLRKLRRARHLKAASSLVHPGNGGGVVGRGVE